MTTPAASTLEAVIAAHSWHAAWGGCPAECGWQSTEGPDEQIEHAAHVAEKVREHLAPLGALADDLIAAARETIRVHTEHEGTDFHALNKGVALDRLTLATDAGDRLRAALAATLGVTS